MCVVIGDVSDLAGALLEVARIFGTLAFDESMLAFIDVGRLEMRESSCDSFRLLAIR